MALENFDFDAFERSHMMCAAISRATADFLEEICDGNLFGPKLPFAPLERLRLSVQAAYKEFVAVPDKPAPKLRVVR
jgi:hypothetical protein